MAEYSKEDDEVAGRNAGPQFDEPAGLRFMTERGKQTGELYYWGTMASENPKILVDSRGSRVSHISAGNDHVLVVTDEGGGRARFVPEIPETKDPEDKDIILKDLAAMELGTDGIARAAVGSSHTLISTTKGEVYAWGRGEQGQLGLPHALGAASPQLLSTFVGKNIIEISAGESHSAAVTDDGGLYMWGSNEQGQCGIGKGIPFSMILTPRFVPSFLGVRISRVSCGYRFTAAVTEQGEIWTWGEGQAGQLGCGRHTTKTVPQLAAAVDMTSGSDGFADVACGWCHCLGLSRGGEIFSWGLNAHGQLGLGDHKARHYPEKMSVAVDGSTEKELKFSQISAGRNYSASLSDSGEMYAWGSQFKGHGGGDSHVLAPKAVELTEGKNFSFVACGEGHIVAFAPTGVRSISPNAGPTDGGTELSIQVDGVWECDEILVRFFANVPVEDEGKEEGKEVEMEEIAETQTGFYDKESGCVKCTTPPWFPAEKVTVEITVNGFDYTANGHEFTYYDTPEINDVTPTSGPITGGTNISIHGVNFVQSDFLKVRLRTIVPEGTESVSEVFVVSGRFISDKCVECNTPTLSNVEDHVTYVSVAVDVALNGIDFTDAGITFDMLNIKLVGCLPQCALRKGGQEILIQGTGLCEVDEPILIKFAFADGRQRIVEGELVPAGDAGEDGDNETFAGVKCACPALDGSPAPQLPQGSTVSTVEPEEVEWKTGYGNEELVVQVSMNGGVDFIADELPFIVYRGFFTNFKFSSECLYAMGGTVLNITQSLEQAESPAVAGGEASKEAEALEEGEASKEDEATEDGEASKEGEAAEDGEASKEDEAAEEGEASKEDEAAKGEGASKEDEATVSDALNNFAPSEATPYEEWIFACPTTKIRFSGSGQDIIVSLDYLPEKKCYTCVAPALVGADKWHNFVLENISKVAEEEAEGEPVEEDEEAPPKPVEPKCNRISVEVSIAVDGKSFETIGTIDYVPPPVVKRVEPAEDVTCDMEMKLFGEFKHCSLGNGFPVGVRITHLGTGEEYDVDGTVSGDSIDFAMPDVEYEPGQEKCKVEVSIDQLTFTEWDFATLKMKVEEEEED
jgi:hypothetical protein